MASHKFLKRSPFYKGLKISEGIFVYCYEELLSHLDRMSDDDFNELLSKNKKLLVDWISDNFDDKELVSKLKNVHSRKKFVSVLKQRVSELKKEEEELSSLVKKREELINKKTNYLPRLWLSVIFVLLAIIIFQQIYFLSENTALNTALEEEKTLSSNLEAINQVLRIEKQFLNDRISDLFFSNQELNDRINALLEESARLTALRTDGPKGRVPQENILLVDDGILIKIENPFFAKFTDTKSMVPTINEESKAIQISPTSESDIVVGDIISFETKDEKIVVHRVVEVGFDDQGWFAITKGDNALNVDKEKVRFEQIRRILVALIY